MMIDDLAIPRNHRISSLALGISSLALACGLMLAVGIAPGAVAAAHAAERDLVPTPPGGGVGTSIAPGDVEPPHHQVLPGALEDLLRRRTEEAVPAGEPDAREKGDPSRDYDEIGGDDVLVAGYENMTT